MKKKLWLIITIVILLPTVLFLSLYIPALFRELSSEMDILITSPWFGKLLYTNKTVEELLKSADRYLELKGYKSAFIVYRYVFENEPNSIWAYQGLTNLRNNNYRKAERYLKKTKRTVAIEELFTTADRYLKEKRYREAFVIYIYILELAPENLGAYKGLANLYYMVDNYREAEHYIKEAEKRLTSETDPTQVAEVYYMAGSNYIGSYRYEGYKHIDKSVEYLLKALKIAEGLDEETRRLFESHIYFDMGMLYSSLDYDEIALDYFVKCHSANPEDNSLNFALAVTHLCLEEYNPACECLKKYQEVVGKEDIDALLGWGYYYTEIGDYPKALEHLSQAQELDPNYPLLLHYALGRYYEKTTDLEKAKEHYRRWFELDFQRINGIANQKIIQRLDINVDDLWKKMGREMEENYSRVFDR